MELVQLRQDIINRRSKPPKGEPYSSIAEHYGISKGMVWKIEHGYNPGEKVSSILGLDPDPDMKYTRNRRKRLNEIAKKWGFSSWCAYETDTINSSCSHKR